MGWISFYVCCLETFGRSFLQGARSGFLDNLKLRFSWGNTGNTNVDPYETLGKLSKTYYSWNETAAIGTIPTGIPNPDLKWEKTEEYNVGLDFSLFNSRLNGTIDWYQRTTKDLILKDNCLSHPVSQRFIRI